MSFTIWGGEMRECRLLFLMLTLLVTRCAAADVDATTLNGRVMCGYQGWFTAAGDENPFDVWYHWSRTALAPQATNLTVEMYPDFSEFDADELFATAMTKGGSPAPLYSGRTGKTVRRHVRWMNEYGIDGVFAQRFVITLHQDAGYTAHLTKVLTNLKASCEEFGRVFAVMYDVSGSDEAWFWETMQADWIALVDSGLMDSPRYLKHNGKPVVGIWGMGFKDGVHPPADYNKALTIINWFKTNAPAKYRATVFGGVPGQWRTRDGDSRTDAGWTTVYRAFNVVSPWTVGRYGTLTQANTWKTNRIVPDLSDANTNGMGYCPVIWPGFSWYNLNAGAKNQIPRAGGSFFWRQAYNVKSAGCSMLYIAMFDEVDEATAIYKVAPTAAQVPDQGYWLTLDADGYSLPSDWYLRLAYEAGRMMRGQSALTATMPAAPGPLTTSRGTPISWLESYGLLKEGFESGDLGDTDGDGKPSWAEYVAGTNPKDGTSFLSLGITPSAASNSVTLSWPGLTGRLYSIFSSQDLAQGVTGATGFTDVAGVNGRMSGTLDLSASPRTFFRLGVRLAP